MMSFTGTDGRRLRFSPQLSLAGEAPEDWSSAMSTKAIVSYDDTPNDFDALMLARVLADAGAEAILAYVRHATEADRERELLVEHQAGALLERGAQTLGDLDVERRVILHASTAEGIR